MSKLLPSLIDQEHRESSRVLRISCIKSSRFRSIYQANTIPSQAIQQFVTKHTFITLDIGLFGHVHLIYNVKIKHNLHHKKEQNATMVIQNCEYKTK